MLTTKKKLFAEYYFQDPNGTRAAIQAGYAEKNARQQASRLLSDVDVQTLLREKLESIITSDEVLERLTTHARATMADFVRIDKNGEPWIDLRNARDLNQMHLIKKVKRTKRVTSSYTETTVELELYDAQAALVQLGKYYRLFTDRVTVDWLSELEALGLDAHAIESELVEQFKGHLARGAARLDGVSLPEGESSA